MQQLKSPKIIHMDAPMFHNEACDNLRIMHEREIRRQCAGVLQGRRVAQLALVQSGQCAGACKHEGHTPANDRYGHAVFTALGRIFAREGVALCQLASHHCGRLLYVFRPDLLMESLNDARVRRLLAQLGYDTRSVFTCVGSLQGRASSEGGTFPCEISFFLGRPYCDTSLLRFSGMTNSLCHGPWKLLIEEGAPSDADERFARNLAQQLGNMPQAPHCPIHQAMN